VLVSAPATLYFGWVSSSANPMWQQALAQYDNLGAFTPSPPHLLILLGVTFFLALGGWAQGLRGMLRHPVTTLRTLSSRDLFLKGWFVTNLVIIYLPLRFQVMLLTGLQFVLAVLATDFVFDHLLPWLEARQAHLADAPRRLAGQLVRWTPALILLLAVPTNLYLLAWRFVDLRRHDYPFYLKQDDVAAMRWLETCATPEDVVLSAFVTGHYLPGLTGTRTFLSNAVMTIDFHAKRAMVEQFFDPATSDEARRAWLRDYGVDYVFYGTLERSLGAFDPSTADYLDLAFTSTQTQVYQTTVGAGGCAQPAAP
jgi:hypothetical protein